MDATIDELKAGWESVREKVKALQLTAQFYAERNQQLIDENRELKESERYLADRLVSMVSALNAKDELLWWVTALAFRWTYNPHSSKAIGPRVIVKLQQMLATQGYTRENLEKR